MIWITDYAQKELGDITFVELPEEGKELKRSEIFATIESVKAASDLYAPIGGEIVEVNEDLADSPETVNTDAYGEGWIFRMEPADAGELNTLMNADDYTGFLAAEDH